MTHSADNDAVRESFAVRIARLQNEAGMQQDPSVTPPEVGAS